MSTTPCTDCFEPGVEGLLAMKGDGQCSKCAGSGKTASQHVASLVGLDEDCPRCDGTGDCPTCDGTGWID